MTGVPKSERSRDQKLEAAQNRTAYWRKKFKEVNLSKEFLDVLRADPEMKWFLLWLGAGAIQQTLNMTTKAAESEEEEETMSWSNFTLLFGGPALQAYALAADNAAQIQDIVADLDLADLTFPGLIGKILKNAGIAGSVSATALAVIIIGRMSQGEGGGLIGKALMAGAGV